MSPVKTNRQRRSKAIRKLLTSSGLTHLPYLPTSIHLRAEIALYTCNILLICASSHNLYRHAYLTNAGDWKYLIAAAVWLGRHIFLRIICASSWVDVGDGIGDRHVIHGLGFNRRRDFDVWLEQHQPMGRSFVRIVYGWFRWIVRAMSPLNVMAKMVYLMKQYGMAGQYCDGSASRGVASAALMMHGTGGIFGSGIDDHHTSSRTNKHGYYGGQHSQTETHTNVILFLARIWGTLCALSSALWALIQSGDVGGETMGHIGATILRWLKSCLAVIVKPSQSSSDHYPGNQQSGGKKSRRKQHNQAGFSDPHISNTGASDRDSLDFLNGKLQMTFQIFPDHIRSRALHIQQMRTSEVFISLQKTWEAFPPAQMQIAIVTFIMLSWAWLFRVDDGYYYRIFFKNSDEDNDPIMPNFGFHKNLVEEQNGGVNGGYLSAYWAGLTPPHVPDIFDADAPSFFNISFRMMSYGTAASLLMYGRVLLPIPEFVAGTNVLKAVRAEARSLTGAIGKNSLKHNKDGMPWMEQYKSITTENRLRLYYKVGIIRTLENVLLCAILPQTEIVCRMTEHCEPGPLLWGASGVTGISGSRYIRGSFDALMKDLIITRISVVVIASLTALLLMAQMTVMNRTYLSLMGYICGEWKIVREDSGNERNTFFGKYSTSPPLRRLSNSTVMQWDPKRRYQKGDRVAFEYCIYEAMSNTPEGPPFDTYLRAAHDLYKEELGHRSTSSLMSNISMGCWMLASMLCGFMFLWKSAGWNFIPLLLMSSACAIAGSVTAHLCDSCSHVIIDLAEEIDAVTSQ